VRPEQVARRISSGEEVSITLDEALGEGPTSLEGLQGMLVEALEGSAAGAAGAAPGAPGAAGAAGNARSTVGAAGAAAGTTDAEPEVDALMATLCGTPEHDGAPPAQPLAQGGAGSSLAGGPDCQLPDWQLAEALQYEEDSAAAAAEAARSQHDTAEQDAALPALLQTEADAALAQRWQEEEDAALAARLAEQEEAAATAAAGSTTTRSSSSSFWSRLQLGSAPALGCGGGSSVLPDAFPSLHVAAAIAAGREGQSEATRQQLRRQHRAAKQAASEAGTGVRMLHRGSPPRSPPTAPGSPLSPRTLAWLEQAGGLGGTIVPPLSLGNGLWLHTDDLDYQLLLRVRRAAAVVALSMVSLI
jgi:hypothetical protein